MKDRISIVGRIVTEPTLDETATGVPHLRMRVATTARRRDAQSGEWVDDDSNFYGVDAYRALADNAHGSLRKGDRVIVAGRLRLRQWKTEDRSGTSPEIAADALGHDLLWGTTMFHQRSPRSGEQRAGAGDGEPAGWAIPEPGDDDDGTATPF